VCGSEALAGPGSTLEATAQLRAWLAARLPALGVRALADLACGHGAWLAAVPLPGVRRTGLDLVPWLVERNRALHPDAEFRVLDVVREPLPPADLALCRDLTPHLPDEDVLRLLENVLAAGHRWLLATTVPEVEANEDLPAEELERGFGWRARNLAIAPFGLGPPLELVRETDPASSDRALGLWDLDEVRRRRAAAAG
jgi:hypothetical protein